MTIQITKSSKGEMRHVEILAKEFIKPLIDRLLKGEIARKLTKSFFENTENEPIKVKFETLTCPFCSRNFEKKRGMKTHITRIHCPKSCSLDIDPYSNESGSDKAVLKCDQCSFKTVNKTKLKKHKKKLHPKAFKKEG